MKPRELHLVYTYPRLMMATKAHLTQAEISREDPDYCWIDGETENGDFLGSWVTGYGFIEVMFPKETTRPLTSTELDWIQSKWIGHSNGISYRI